MGKKSKKGKSRAGKSIPKAGSGKTHHAQKSKRSLTSDEQNNNPNDASASAAGGTAPRTLKVPDPQQSSRRMINEGLEITQSMGGTEFASVVEDYERIGSDGVERSEETRAVEIESLTKSSSAKAGSAAAAKSSSPVASEEKKEPTAVEQREQSTEEKQQQQPPPPPEPSPLPLGLEDSLPLFTQSQRDLVVSLCRPPANQSHLFESWPEPSASSSRTLVSEETKKRFVRQLETMDKTYPAGGLMGYIANARDLLDKSRRGVNPLEGWTPRVPRGEAFDVGTDRWATVEARGVKHLGSCGFVLVAGGLGERLGYGDIKIGLPTELATETCYIQYYIETILAYQAKYAKPGTKLPLCIMTSGDTNAKTVALLKANSNFGMADDQITIVQQGEGVPALSDNDARIALDPDDPYRVQAKPHGHGDVHALLYSHGVAERWLKKLGMKYAVFFQDTNGLAFHSLPLALGVSDELGLAMNSLAVPRKAKQAIGGIAQLEKATGEQRTINVEYNQLDPLLRATGYPDGDVNDPKTGFSPFPGNINQLLFELEPYVAAINRTNGAMPEFVNPKYKDAAKTQFKKPTRLECMMQDFPTVLEGEASKRVGFTSVVADMCFSPVKNATSDGVNLQAKGTHPGVAASGEADQYCAVRKILRSIGCSVEEAKPATFAGITVVPGPEVVLKPSFVSCPAEYRSKFSNPSGVKISARSSLVVKGAGVTIESLDLDGALVVECEEGVKGVIRNLVVKNKGWVKVADESNSNEVIKMRAYHLEKIETKVITFKKDGSIEGDYVPYPELQEVAAPEEAEAVAEKKASAVEEEKKEVKQRELPSLTEPAAKEAGEKKNDCACVIL